MNEHRTAKVVGWVFARPAHNASRQKEKKANGKLTLKHKEPDADECPGIALRLPAPDVMVAHLLTALSNASCCVAMTIVLGANARICATL